MFKNKLLPAVRPWPDWGQQIYVHAFEKCKYVYRYLIFKVVFNAVFFINVHNDRNMNMILYTAKLMVKKMFIIIMENGIIIKSRKP